MLVTIPVRLLDFAERDYITVAVLDEEDMGFMANIRCFVFIPKMPRKVVS